MKTSVKVFLSLTLLFSTSIFAGGPAGTNFGIPPATMIGPISGTKMVLEDGNNQYHISSLLAANVSAAPAFIQFFDQECLLITLGTTTPTFVIPVRANDWTFVPFPITVDFFTPICVASTTTPRGAVGSAANSVFMQVFTP